MKSIFKIKFLKNILILSSLIAVGLPLFVILFIYPSFHGLLTKNTEDMAISIARHLSSDVIGNQDMLSRDSLSDETLSDIQGSVNHFGLMKLKIFSKSGEIIFSTVPKDIGEINKKTYFRDFVAKGKVYTKSVKKGTKSLEDQIVTADVVETYIPIIKNDKFIGAFEIYYDITNRKERLDKLLHTSSLVLILLAISFQCTIIISLFKASKNIIKRENAEEQRGRLVLKLQDAFIRVETLSAISQTVNKTLDLDQVLNDALDVVMGKFKPHSAHIRLLDNQTQELAIVAHKGLTPEDLKKLTKRKKLEETVSHPIKSVEAVVIEDILTDPRAEGKDSFTQKIGCRSLVTLILYARDKIVGNMAIRFLETRAYTDEEIRLFTSIGHQISIAIENANLFSQVKQHTETLSILNIISQTVSRTLDLDKILNGAIENIIELLKVDGVFLRFLSEDDQELVLNAHKGFTTEQLSKLPISRKYGDGSNWKTLLSDQVVHMEFNPEDPYQQQTNSFGMRIGAHSAILFPLKSKDKMLGTMAIYSFAIRKFTEQEIELCTNIGDQIGIAIENARLYKDKELTIKELKDAQEQLQQSQKMESIGTLAGGIAHDFNNILGIIVGNTELALDDVPEWNPAHANLEEIKTASLRAAGIVKQLLNFSRRTDMELKPIGAISVIKDALKFLRSTIPTTIEIRKHLPDTDVAIFADPTQINQVMMNLCINASQAMEQTGGNLTVNVEEVILDDNSARDYPDLRSGKHVKVTVSDTGSGIDPEIIGRIFDPYFTTKEVGKGSGMGLAVVHGIVKNYNGAISVASESGKGATFTILFPVATEKPVMEVKTPAEIPRGNETILFVDDEKSIVNVARKVLERLGYKVESKLNPVEALEQFQSKPDQFDLVITDMTMPQMTGVILSEKIMEIRPDIPVIICTGHSALIDKERAKRLGIAAYIMKPIIMTEIAKTIRKVLDETKN